MRILQVHNAYQQAGGEDAVVEQEGALLAGRGHDVRLWSVSNDEIGGAWAKLRTAWQVPYSQGARRQLGRVIADFAPDVLIQVDESVPVDIAGPRIAGFRLTGR